MVKSSKDSVGEVKVSVFLQVRLDILRSMTAINPVFGFSLQISHTKILHGKCLRDTDPLVSYIKQNGFHPGRLFVLT